MVLESTYGDRVHEGRRERRQRLQQVLERTLANKGTTIVPAFSLGRTQELLYELNAILERRERQKISPGAAAGGGPISHSPMLPSPGGERGWRSGGVRE